jgi:predicted metal-binding membrane protein
MLRVGALAGRGRSIPHDGAVEAVLATAAAAWLVSIGLAVTPFAADFGHAALERVGRHPWVLLTLTAAWVLMVVATMLPTTLRLVSAYNGPLPRLLAGYLIVWMIAGIAMHAGDLGVHWLVHRSSWLHGNTWAIGATTLAVAGLYQFSPPKARALSCCREPASSIQAGAFRTGFHHGVQCLACCWSLMLLMFSVGIASVLWMVALAAAMLAEKVTPLGRRASTPIGAWLLCCAVLTAATATG